jgi:hypothetical protein
MNKRSARESGHSFAERGSDAREEREKLHLPFPWQLRLRRLRENRRPRFQNNIACYQWSPPKPFSYDTKRLIRMRHAMRPLVPRGVSEMTSLVRVLCILLSTEPGKPDADAAKLNSSERGG